MKQKQKTIFDSIIACERICLNGLFRLNNYTQHIKFETTFNVKAIKNTYNFTTVTFIANNSSSSTNLSIKTKR